MKQQKLIESEQSKIEIIEGEDSYHRARFLVTTVDVANRNNRTYPKELAVRETLMSFADGRVQGMSKHPVSDPDPLDHFLVFEKAMLEGDHEYFVAKVAPTSKGKDFIELAKAGAMFSVSRRGTGELKEGTDKLGKKTKIVIPESYRLYGIDVLYPDTQSDPNGRMIQFEAIESNTEEPMELTLEQLREDNGELVTQIEDAATQPLKEQVTQLEGQVETLTAEKDTALKLAEETQTKLTEIETKVAELTALVEDLTVKANNAQALLESEKALTEQVTTLTEQVNALTEADKAHKHLIEKVKGERAAWLILDELKVEPTVAAVDAKFDEAKRKCDALIEHAAQPAGKTVYTGDENKEIDEAKTKQGKPTPEISQRQKTIARAYGLAS